MGPQGAHGLRFDTLVRKHYLVLASNKILSSRLAGNDDIVILVTCSNKFSKAGVKRITDNSAHYLQQAKLHR